jgi:hypothetical protein
MNGVSHSTSPKPKIDILHLDKAFKRWIASIKAKRKSKLKLKPEGPVEIAKSVFKELAEKEGWDEGEMYRGLGLEEIEEDRRRWERKLDDGDTEMSLEDFAR